MKQNCTFAAATKRMASVNFPVFPTELHRSFRALSPAHPASGQHLRLNIKEYQGLKPTAASSN